MELVLDGAPWWGLDLQVEVILWCPVWHSFRAMAVFRNGGQRPEGYRVLPNMTYAGRGGCPRGQIVTYLPRSDC